MFSRGQARADILFSIKARHEVLSVCIVGDHRRVPGSTVTMLAAPVPHTMFSKLGLVLLLTLALLNAASADLCQTDTFGDITAMPMQLNTSYIEAGKRDALVTVPSHLVCPYGYKLAGLKVEVCDADMAPRVRIRSVDSALVHRRGLLFINATVYTTVYCRQGYGQ
ncbi:uncharacterized protein LOC116412782 [Galleria mellonella]|uniref:Uncharacterized protein LOC116412782 n=1 Tax=Galleria mellonella TaxID=7137 RepID=A0A6J3BV15_GALME|nr:uncharacterized protein LOC116412782 [Galleria mellonella]